MTDDEARAKLAANTCPRCNSTLLRRNDPSPLGGDWVAVWWRCTSGHGFEVVYNHERHDYQATWPGWAKV